MSPSFWNDGNNFLTKNRYVINSEAAKALYKTMPGKASKEPKDLGREWHSDGAYIAFNREACQLTSPAFSDV